MQHDFFCKLFGGFKKRSYLYPRLIDFCIMKQQFPAGGCKAAARPAQDNFMCLGHEFETLPELLSYFSSQGLDYAISAAGCLVYHGDISIGHLTVQYPFFDPSDFEVSIKRVGSHGKEV